MDIYEAALRGGAQDLVECLDQGIDPNISNEQQYTPLMAAAHDGRLENISILVDRGAKINSIDESGFTALMLAIQHSTINAVELLLSLGANVNHISKAGFTPLMFVPYNNYPKTDKVDLTHLLLSKGADKTLKDSSNLTAFDRAKQKGLKELLVLLSI